MVLHARVARPRPPVARAGNAARIGDSQRLIDALGLVHLNYLESGAVDAAPHLAAADLCIERLTELEPESASRHALTGLIARHRGHIRESIVSLTRALQLDPNNSDVVAYLTLALLLAGQDERAREMAELGVRLDPLTPLFQIMPAFCDVVAGRADAAVPPYRRLVASDPGNPVAHFFMLLVLTEAGDMAAATVEADLLEREFAPTVFGAVGAMFARGIRLPPDARRVDVTPAMRAVAATANVRARAGPLSLSREELARVRAPAHAPALSGAARRRSRTVGARGDVGSGSCIGPTASCGHCGTGPDHATFWL